jgi:hypothetical protein
MSGSPVLILVRRQVVLEDAGALLRSMVRDGRSWSPIVVCPSPALAARLEEAAGERLRFVGYNGRELKTSAGQTGDDAAGPRGIPSALRRSYLVRMAVAFARLLVYRLRAAQLFRRCPASLLVVFEDRAPCPEMVYLAEARRRGAKAVLVSFAASSVESDAASRRDRPEHLVDQGPWRRLKQAFAQWYPHQVRETSFGRMLFFSLPETVALSACGLLDGRNWHFGGGAIDLCTKISREDLELARKEGAPVERFVVTGQPMMDAMHEARRTGKAREHLTLQYSLRPDRRLLICAVPHAGEHGLVAWDRHLSLTRELFRALAASGADVLLSLHPRSRADTYRDFAAESGCAILKKRLSAALPAADLFVASYSSTVRWALLMGIPTIMADFLQFRYEQFAALPGSMVVEDAAALGRALKRLVSDGRELERMGREAAGAAAGVPFDGKVCARIMREMARLLGARD